ncbi:MAG: DUF2092 domain-containing protein [Candidatus Binatia bacterium]
MNRRARLLWSTAALPVVLLLATLPANGQAGKADENASRAQAMAVIDRMSTFLTDAKQFSVAADVGYDIVQEWGQKIEFGETRVLSVRRPDRLRVDTTDRDGSVSGVVFDGKEIAVFDLQDKVYAIAEKPGTLGAAIGYFVNDLGMRLPMAAIISGQLTRIIGDWANQAEYVGQASIAGVACDQVAFRGDWEDVQMWVARGDRPLLQRMVITYTRAEGKPQFWAQLRDWNLSPDLPDSFFAFTPPAGLAKIAFAPRGQVAGAMGAQAEPR